MFVKFLGMAELETRNSGLDSATDLDLDLDPGSFFPLF